jgi:hypothetical protein
MVDAPIDEAFMALRVAVLTLIAAAAFLVRAGLGADLVDGSRVLPFPDDPPYHWMRLERLLQGPIAPDAIDPMVAHPQGAVAHWPWGFDHLLHLIADVAGAGTDGEAARRATAWAIPALGALLVFLTYLVAARVTTRRRALLAALFIAVLPKHVEYTMAGRVDHHVMEPLLTVLGLLGPLAAWSKRRWLPACILSGIASGSAFAFFPAALHPVALALVLVGGALALEAPGAAIAYAAATWVGTAASLLVSPHAAEWVFYSPSLVHVALIGLVAAGVIATAVMTRVRPDASAVRRLSNGAVMAGLGATAAVLVFPDLLTSVTQGFAYLGSEGFASLSREASPLLSDPYKALLILGVLSPLALVGLARISLGGGDDGETPRRTARAVGFLGLAFLGVALFQRRFATVAAPFIAIGVAEALGEIGRRLGPRLAAFGVRPPLRIGIAIAVVTAAVALDLSTISGQQPLGGQDRAMLKASALIERRRQDLGADGAGALVPWGYGHLVQWRAGVPTVCDNFFGPPENDAALRECLGFLYEGDPATAAAMLRRDKVRWVVLLPPHPEEIRVEARLLGRDPTLYVDATDRLLPGFARTSWGTLGIWARTAAPEEVGPLGLRLLDRIVQTNPANGTIEAEILVFEAADPSPPS